MPPQLSKIDQELSKVVQSYLVASVRKSCEKTRPIGPMMHPEQWVVGGGGGGGGGGSGDIGCGRGIS